MANYLGYALKAGVEGFKSGFGMAQQKSEMEWQKKQKKKLEEEQAKLEEEATLYNSVVSQLGADGFYSEDDMMKINTTYLALGYKTQDSLKNAHNALLTMDKNTFDREMGQLNSTIELLKSGLLDPKDATAVFEYGRNNWATSEKVQNLYEAADNIYAKSHGAMQEEKTWERVGKLPTEARVPYLKQEGVEMPEVTPEVKEPTFNEKRFNWKIEQYNQGRITLNQLLESEGIDMLPEKATGLEKQIQDIKAEGERAGIDPAKINKAIQDKILGKEEGALTPTPTSVENTREDIKDADTVEDARRIHQNQIEKYGEKGLGIDDIDKFWAESQIPYLDNIKTTIGNIIDEKGWLKKGTLTSAEVGVDFKGEQPVEEIYKMLREEYMEYRSKLEKLGVDISQFPELKPLEEIEKVGLGEGFWGIGKQKGQYKSIYY